MIHLDIASVLLGLGLGVLLGRWAFRSRQPWAHITVDCDCKRRHHLWVIHREDEDDIAMAFGKKPWWADR